MKRSTYILIATTLALTSPLVGQVLTATSTPSTRNATGSFPLSTGARMWAPVGTGEVVLVIPPTGMSAETVAELRKDMHIMCQIFDRRLEEANLRPSGRPRMFAPNNGGTTTRGVYLPGFGPLFLLEADFPLLPGPAKAEPAVEESGDALWLEIKQQMENQAAPNAPARVAPEYDATTVEKFRRTLTKAMKHAANLRHVDPDNQIVVVAVNGSKTVPNGPGILFSNAYGQSVPVLPTTEPTTLQVMALRATKADLDAYAGAQLTDDQFRERTGIATYELPSAGVSGGAAPITVPRTPARR